jgi:hypothetical protein
MDFSIFQKPNNFSLPHTFFADTLQPLIPKQKGAIRIISNKKYNDHTEPLFKDLNILPLPDPITLFNLKLFHSFFHRYIPSAFENSWTTKRNQREGVANIELRNDDDFYIPRHRTELILRLPLFNFPITWNLLHTELTDFSTKCIFVKSASFFFLKVPKHEIFYGGFFALKEPIWSPDS